MPDAPITFSPVPSIVRIPLDSGLTLVVCESWSSPHVSVRVSLPGGTVLDPPGKEGLTSLTAACLRSGAGDRGEAELSEHLDHLAARLSTSAGRHVSEVSGDITTVRPGQLEELLDLVADVLLRPTFPEAEVEKVKTRRLGSLAQLADDHASLCSRAFEQVVFRDHLYGRPNSGTPATIPGLSRDDVADCHSTVWRPDGAIIALAGAVSPKDAERLVVERLGAWTGAPPHPDTAPEAPAREGLHLTLVDRADPTLSQVHFRIGGALDVRLDSPDYFAFRVAAQLFGGDFTARLNQRLRVKDGLTYGARYSYGVNARRSGSAAITTYTPAGAAPRAIAIAIEELRRLAEEPIGEPELLEFQRKLVHSFPFRFETPAATVDQYLWVIREGLPGDFLDTYQQRVAAVTAEELQEAARRHICREDLEIAVVANADAAGAFEETAGEGRVEVRPMVDFGI